MQPTRRYKRYRVDIMQLNGSMILAKFVKIINISIGGMCLETEKRLMVGSQYTINVDNEGRSLKARGIIVWSSLTDSLKDSKGNIIPIYRAGMKFTDVSNEKVHEIVDFMETHRQSVDKAVNLNSPSGHRLFVRICIEDPAKAVLDYHYKIKNLSRGGMLIESEHALDLEGMLPMEMNLADKRSIKFSGIVASCLLVRNKDNEYYDIGIDFLEMSEREGETLNEFIGLIDTVDQSL
jgi:c-di-GMP-binding flagellar brake protein YcgR